MGLGCLRPVFSLMPLRFLLTQPKVCITYALLCATYTVKSHATYEFTMTCSTTTLLIPAAMGSNSFPGLPRIATPVACAIA
jgi:hypothetical protein